MADPEMLARIDENVKSLVQYRKEDREAFDAHVIEDKQITKEFLRPLWEESQQRKGAKEATKTGSAFMGYAINAGIACAAAWAAVKGLGK